MKRARKPGKRVPPRGTAGSRGARGRDAARATRGAGAARGSGATGPRRRAPEPAAQGQVRVRVNGTEYVRTVEVRKTLADFVREDIGLTGTHLGCEHGVCGACTILFDGQPARSCLLFAVQADGADIMTVEAMGTPEHLSPLQQAYMDHHALQCGFCTPGFLISSLALLRENPHPTEQEVREYLSGHLCRCTGYQNIVDAVLAAAASGAVAATDARGD